MFTQAPPLPGENVVIVNEYILIIFQNVALLPYCLTRGNQPVPPGGIGRDLNLIIFQGDNWKL